MPKRLIPFAKIEDDAVRRIIQGFCGAETINEIAAASGVSEKTCRAVVLALRPRLLKERFDQWRETAFMRTSTEPEIDTITQAMVYVCLAACYFNRACYTNHQQGRRQSRMCKSCTVPALDMGEDFDAAMLYQIDLIHGFYAVLGIGGERGIGKLSQFRARLVHTQVVGEACEATRRDADDRPDFSHRDNRAVRSLYEQIIRDLENQPLDRRAPAEPALEPFEDLTFLK